METVINKISSYNLFNYLLPGVLYALFVSMYSPYDLIVKDLLFAGFFYYFIGLVISRIGSLIIEPLLKATKWIKFSEYARYVEAVKKDPTIAVLSEQNNSFRSIISMLVCAVLTIAFSKLEIPDSYLQYFIGALLLLFLFSYRKQTKYIHKRVKANTEEP